MVDIHTHVLWAVDDGPKMFSEALQLIRQAARQGVTDIIATPHRYHPKFDVAPRMVQQQVYLLQQYVQQENSTLRVHAGQEVRICQELITRLEDKHVLTLADSRYILIELPTFEVPFYAEQLFQKLRQRGIVPIIAHPERNRLLCANARRVQSLLQTGALFQVTAGSFVGQFGRKVQRFAWQLLAADAIHVYGSDVHDQRARPFLFQQGLTALRVAGHEHRIAHLLHNNECVLWNEAIVSV